MQAIEIILLVCGALAFVISFFLPDRGDAEDNTGVSPDEIRAMVEDEIAASRDRIEDMTEETMNYALEKAERSLDRISNEKMLAFGEYSDNVLDQIGKNQQESVFLHDMLNKNKDELTELLNRADSASKDASVRANEAYDLAGSAKELAQEAYDQAATAGRHATVAEERMIDARKRLDTSYATEERAYEEKADTQNTLTADEVIARAQTVAALRRQSMINAMAAAEEEEEVTEEPYVSEPEQEEREEALPEAVYDEEPEVKPPAEEVREEEQVAHRMTALERIAALKSNPKPAEEEPEITVIPEETPVTETKEDAGEMKVPGADEETEKAPAKSRAKRTVKKSTTRAGAKGSTQMSLQDLMPQEPVSLQFSAGGGPVNNNQRILEMHKMGRSNMAIAKELGLGLGEVKLVIDLFENS